MMGMARESGFKVVVANRGDTGLSLANELQPDAITLDIQLPVVDGWKVLDRLKRNPRTRHIPVHVISVVDAKRRGSSLGAFAYLEKPVSKEALDGAFEHIKDFLDRKVRRLLLVEDDAHERRSITALVGDRRRRRRRRDGRRWRRRGRAGGARQGAASTAWSSIWCCPR